jgi:predicted signal transduction protein with EAL and GGDEF domain
MGSRRREGGQPDAGHTEDQLNILRRLGCDLIQGFYFCRPIPGREVEVFLKGEAADGAPAG